MRRVFLLGTLAVFCLALLGGCRSRSDEPVTLSHKFFNRLPSKPKDTNP